MNNSNIGHGHVNPRPDGVRARCGGPGICSECSKDAALAKTGTTGGTATATSPAPVKLNNARS